MRHDNMHRGRHHGGRGRHEHHERFGGRLRHGDVRTAILMALSEGPAHGYEIGQRLLRASGGAWQPSPGSIYPTLQTLSDEDMVTSEERDGKRVYTLSKSGQSELAERQQRGEGAPWEGARGGELREALVALRMAVRQVGAVGTTEQRGRAKTIIDEARRQLYELLAKA
jgi:DNA-binding PadR family transcriptional regulator